MSPFQKKKEPRQDRSKQTVDIILQSVVDLVAQGSQDQLTTTKIAERAGVSVGSVYQYFPSKESIFKSLVEWYFKKEFDLFRNALLLAGGKTLDQAVEDTLSEIFAIRAKNLRLEQTLTLFFFRVGDLDFLRKFDEQMIAELEKVLIQSESEGKLKRTSTTAFLLLHLVRSSFIAITIEKPEIHQNKQASSDFKLNLKKAIVGILQ